MPCDKKTQEGIAEKVKKLLSDYEQHIELDKEIDDIINKIYGR